MEVTKVRIEKNAEFGDLKHSIHVFDAEGKKRQWSLRLKKEGTQNA